MNVEVDIQLPVAASKRLLMALRQALAQPAFLIAVLVLGAAAAGLGGATAHLQLHFRKLPVPLADEALKNVPQQLGPWLAISGDDQPLDRETEEMLGTRQCIFRDYVDTRRVGQARLDAFAGKNWEERRKLLAAIEAADPQAVVHLAVTYYTGLVDTVAHIPDRCYIADGYQPSEYTVETWDVSGGPTSDGKLQVRFINFEDQAGYGSRVPRSVAYFFRVNGRYESDPLGVRRSLQNLLERHGYYAKVELMTLLPDRQVSARVMTDFLTAAMPEIHKALPDWDAVRKAR